MEESDNATGLVGCVAPEQELLLEDLLISAGSKKENTDFDADIC